MLKILISSNSPLGMSGYSTQSKGIARALQAMGHDVSFYAWYGQEAGQLSWEGMRVYPRLTNQRNYGADAGKIAGYGRADLVLSLQDIWVLPGNFAETLPCPWLAYFPVDGDPPPPAVAEQAKQAAFPVVYSRFALTEMEAAGVACDYVPHAIDTNIFYPSADRDALRKEQGIPDGAFIVSMVAANVGYPSRKSFPEALEAFARFHERHPESILYLHTDRHAPKRGYHLDLLAQQLGIPKQAVRFVRQMDYALGLPDEYIADVYRWSDVLLSPSMGEGFGLPIAEAQACGCPVITQDCTSMSELTVNGIAIEPLQRFYTLLGHWQYTASIERIDEALEGIYGWSGKRREMNAAAGVRHFHENYSWPAVAERHWQPLMEKVEAVYV